MACSTFEKRITIRSTADAIYAELSDPGRQVGLQPLLVETEELVAAASGSSRTFIAIEAVPVALGWTLRNRIEVRIDLTRPGEVVEFHARSIPGVRVYSRFTLTPDGDRTTVHECVRVEMPRLLRAFIAARAEAAHAKLLCNLKRRLELDGEAT
ncbi:MAG: SRPBCC family protein [Deltaproteobacteria bacterium]|nr:SRPBCC family protein [Deltaproteobacteria bacterium]MBW2399360.1 SRPBCC family protein [Deltaproteobacteria bacterium]